MRNSKIIAITGKGGVGKTSLSAIIVKLLSQKFPEKKILAIDADPAVGLSTALNMHPELTLDDIRCDIIASVEEGKTAHALDLVSESRYRIFDALVEKDNVAFLAIGRPESAGCYCRINSYLKDVITMLSKSFDYVVIDGEAGIEQINRRVMEEVTHLLLVSDASRKGLEVTKTIKDVADEMVKFEKIGLIVNRVENSSYLDSIDTSNIEILSCIPSDTEILNFDVGARPFFDLPDDSVAVSSMEKALEKFEYIL